MPGIPPGTCRSVGSAEISPLPSRAPLSQLLDEPIVVVDVGARWGFSSAWDDLGDRYLAIGFEPDAEECERLVEVHRQAGTRHRVVPFALGARPGMATLHVTKQAACSSLYVPSPRAYGRHPTLEVITPQRSVIVDLTTLDTWCAREGVESVDVIKVDTQGSELDVLHGAVATLGSVRAVEAEVEFNELYEGAPLFGDVDRFLRSHGFVLWKLRDLAHYAQRGARTDWRTVDVWQLDADAYTFDSGPGQVFWANAYYLRAPVAYPDRGLGWMQLLRDGLITGALGFHDLSALALELAAEAAPANAASRIRSALCDPLPQPSHGAPSTSIRRRGTFKLGFADPEFAGGGWHPPQQLEYAGVRWSGPGRDAWVNLPLAVPEGTRMEILAVAAMSHEISEGLTVALNGVPVALRRSPHEHGTLYSGTVAEPAPGRPTRDFTRLMIQTPATVAWSALHPEDPDDLELGIAIAWVRLTLPGPGPEARPLAPHES